MFINKMNTVVVVCALMLGATQAMYAAKSGTVKFITGGTYKLVTTPFLNAKLSMGDYHGIYVLVNDHSDLFAQADKGTVLIRLMVVKSQKGLNITGYTTMTDQAGDSWYFIVERKTGTFDKHKAGGLGKSVIKGGTGKYAQLSGTCSYKVSYFKGHRWSAPITCHWKLP